MLYAKIMAPTRTVKAVYKEEETMDHFASCNGRKRQRYGESGNVYRMRVI